MSRRTAVADCPLTEKDVLDLLTTLKSVRKGDFRARMSMRRTGIAADVAEVLNDIIENNENLASELASLSDAAGKKGRLETRAVLPGARGSWAMTIRSVNTLVDDLVQPTSEVARVIGAVAEGNLAHGMPLEIDGRPLQGAFLNIANTVNRMVGQLNSFASEVTRVAREVGAEGKLGGQARVKGVAGIWKDLTQNVNSMANNLTSQVRNIADVTTAVAKGDLSKKIEVKAEGEILLLKNTINTMVDQLSSFASEVTRVAREVGTDGKLGGQARVKGVAGVWQDLTDNVNSMANNLTNQVRNIADVTTAVANGDLSRKITVEVQGEILQLKNTINTMVDQLSSFASEVTRVAREVGTEGKLGGQARVRGTAGIWKDLTDNVNSMANNLTSQVRNIAEVTQAVAKGDLSKKIGVRAEGEILQLKNTINTMVDQLSSFASEVTRVAREVGTEGKLGGQARVKGVAGIWKDLTQNVNSMANNLTNQVRNITAVTKSIADGDLSRKITVRVRGEMLQLKNTINTMVDQLSSFASEVSRVAREVGTEGKLGGQARVRGVAGIWKDLTQNVNSMANNLTSQVRNIADVNKAIARGDLSRKITVRARGEILQLKKTINSTVDLLNAFASEVTRVAREVGTDGKLGGQARVKDVAGIWKDLTNNVNSMANNLTNQVRNIAEITTAVANGDLSRKITVEVKGEILQLKNTINTMVDQLSSFASEVTRVAREVGTEGKLGGQARVRGVAGIWKDLTDNVNSMANNLTSQVRNIAEVTEAVAKGDLSRKITVAVQGEILQLKNTINTMVDQLSSFASEVTRVAREVGTDGKLGGQARVKGVAGIWKDLTDNVNSMASNLTSQVRNIATVVTAVAKGDLKQKLSLRARGEIAALGETINSMIDTLETFAAQVTTVAREVGVDGKLGGQARVPGAVGMWRDLTDNVNQLAENLTTQVRSIADVSTAVTKGDLTQEITVGAQGEVAALKDTINEMIRNLRVTTRKNTSQDWLKTNLAKFTRMLQGQRELEPVAKQILSEMVPLVSAQFGAFYLLDEESGGQPSLKLLSSYGIPRKSQTPPRFLLGEGMVGQCAEEKQRFLVTAVPKGYLRIRSGLGEGSPEAVTVLPVLFEGQVKAVIELASFRRFEDIHLTFLDQLTESIGIVLNTIAATMRTEALLKQSQSLAQELQQTNAELKEKARLLADQKKEVETKNREIEVARQAIEEKAEQLALTSKYKSQFLANMSHELRTPLNSLLILARTLSENAEGNLKDKQVEFSKTIYAAGKDLLALINDILDLSKIESGTISVEISEVACDEIQEYVDRSFRQVAEEKRLAFAVERGPDLPKSLNTDPKRLQQVLRNFLSNAIKFTAEGRVSLKMSLETGGWKDGVKTLDEADAVLAFSVSDTGIGIPKDKQKIVFEAFQQVDMTTSRKYGGTGLGLSICREIAGMLGGDISLKSEPGRGSTFTLYIPRSFVPMESAVLEGEEPGGASDAQRPEPRSRHPAKAAPVTHHLEDDRSSITDKDRVLLVVEDDIPTARILIDLGRKCGFRVLAAVNGEQALHLLQRHSPHAVTLDLCLPDMEGWVLFDRLKHDPSTRHVPVLICSVDERSTQGLLAGAYGYLTKPASAESLMTSLRRLRDYVDRGERRVLVIEDDGVQRMSLVELVANDQVRVVEAATAEEGMKALEGEPFDCLIVDLKLPDIPGSAVVAKIRGTKEGRDLPVIVYTGKDIDEAEQRNLRSRMCSVVLKGEGSPETLLAALHRHLNLPWEALSKTQQGLLGALYEREPLLAGRTVLIVDDDVRNLFAMTSLLERYGMRVRCAENGIQGLTALEQAPRPDLVLMDLMMPGMDGYETIRRIRRMKAFRSLPIIALTAKALPVDRAKCIEAGASDYIRKPVEIEQLRALLRVWLGRSGVEAGERYRLRRGRGAGPREESVVPAGAAAKTPVEKRGGKRETRRRHGRE